MENQRKSLKGLEPWESERRRERESALEKGYKLGNVLIIQAHLVEQTSLHLYIA